MGLKPTYGLVSRYGLTALSWSLDHPGPMARTVEDAALTMNVIAGHDTNDVASVAVDVPDYTTALTGEVRGLRIGVPKEYFDIPVDPQVDQAVRDALRLLESMGAVVTEVPFPTFSQAPAISTPILMAEAAAYHRDMPAEDLEKLEPSVRLRLEAGLLISAADYLRAQQTRSVFNREVRQLLREVDLLAGPSRAGYRSQNTEHRGAGWGKISGSCVSADAVYPALQHYRFSRHLNSLWLLRRRSSHRFAVGGPALR